MMKAVETAGISVGIVALALIATVLLIRLVLWFALKRLNKSRFGFEEPTARDNLLDNPAFEKNDSGFVDDGYSPTPWGLDDEETSNSVGGQYGQNPSGIQPSGVSWTMPPRSERAGSKIKRRNRFRRKMKGRIK